MQKARRSRMRLFATFVYIYAGSWKEITHKDAMIISVDQGFVSCLYLRLIYAPYHVLFFTSFSYSFITYRTVLFFQFVPDVRLVYVGWFNPLVVLVVLSNLHGTPKYKIETSEEKIQRDYSLPTYIHWFATTREAWYKYFNRSPAR